MARRPPSNRLRRPSRPGPNVCITVLASGVSGVSASMTLTPICSGSVQPRRVVRLIGRSLRILRAGQEIRCKLQAIWRASSANG